MYSLQDTWGFPCEFPHSEIFGSLAMCAYPKLIAAYHVLHRLLMPRHSPCALCSLTFMVYNFKSFKTKILYKEYFLACCIIQTIYLCAIFKEQFNWETFGLSKLNSKLRINLLKEEIRLFEFFITSITTCYLDFSIERRWSSRRFSYGYLVTTSPQSLTLP